MAGKKGRKMKIGDEGRFRRKAVIPNPHDYDTCWMWAGARSGPGNSADKTSKGHGQFRLDGKRVYAHRYAYELYKGKIPEGMKVLHKCDTYGCVNPEHLFLGTQADNARDMVLKDRHSGVITMRDREDILHSVEPSTILAKKYGVTNTAINEIRRAAGIFQAGGSRYRKTIKLKVP